MEERDLIDVRRRLVARLDEARQRREDLFAQRAGLIVQIEETERKIAEYEDILGVARRTAPGGNGRRRKATKAEQRERLKAIGYVLGKQGGPLSISELHKGVAEMIGPAAGDQRQTGDILRRNADLFVQVGHGVWDVKGAARMKEHGRGDVSPSPGPSARL